MLLHSLARGNSIYIYLYIYIYIRLKYKPNDWGIIVNLGDAKKELGQCESALVDYDLALKLSSDSLIIIVLDNKPEVV